MALQSLVLPLVSVFRSAGFNEAFKAIKNLDGGFKEVAKSAGMAAASFAAAGVLQSVTRYIDEAVVATQKFERNMLALNQVFEANFSGMTRFTKDAQDMGISQGQAAQAAVFLGSVLKQYGLDASATSSETQKLIGLSQDLATTYGYDLQEALLAMTALFRGEYDPIEKFGVAMKQSEINAVLASRGQAKLTGELLMQAQVQARLDLLYQRSADAMGAFDRASGTLYASQQKLNAAIENQQIAFGEPLQKPLAIVTDLFAKLAVMLTPMTSVFGQALGAVIELLGSALTRIADGTNAVIDYVNGATDAIRELIGVTNEATNGDPQKMDQRAKQLYNLEQRVYGLKVALEQAGEAQTGLNANENIVNLTNQLKKAENELAVFQYATYDADTELRRFQLQAERTKTTLEETAPALSEYTLYIKDLGLYSEDAEGKLSGLASVFEDIEVAAQKSSASEVLKDIGFNAGQIETILTKPDWAQIFGQISRLAKIAAIDIASIGGSAQYAAAAGQGAASASLQKLLDELKGDAAGGGPAAKKPRDAVKELFNELRDEANKQAASLKLAGMGASQGLIDLILGDKDWSKLWKQIQTGVISLQDLQRQFNNTAAGADELAAAAKAAADAQQEMLDKLTEKLDKANQKFDDAKEAAKQLTAALNEASTISILPTVADDIGEFQSQIQGIASNVSGILREALDNGSLLQANYDELVKFANEELAVLEANARQRDELYKRYSFTENIINEYRAALTGALSLTSLFNKLSKETEKRTVTEVTKGIRSLGSSVKEFAVTMSKSYEETIDAVTNKTGGLLDGFRQMAEKSRAFAKNLRTLKDMGLDPKLFSQLVQAGVEAGGETAQAIVDGGQAAVDELGSIYNEIDKIGGELGLDMAPTFYNAGDKLMESLLSGIKAQQTALENTARTLATAFSAAFQSRVAIAVQVPVTNAQTAATNAANAVNNVNTGAIERINKLIAQATQYFNSPNISVDQMVGAYEKIGAYNALLQDLMSGQVTDISGIAGGMTTADLRTAALATGGTNVTNYYNVEVNASGYAGGVQAGQAVIEEIINFERNNGSSGRFLIQAQ